MAEFEELKIVVSLTDNATAGLRQFQQTMRDTASGPTARHMEDFSRKGGILKDTIKALGLEATGTGKQIEGLTTKIFGVSGSIAGLVSAVAVATERIGKMADSINQTSRSWEALGTTLAHGKNITEQLARMGVDEQKAMELTGNAIRLHVEAQKRGWTESFRDLRQRFGEGFAAEFREAIGKAGSPEAYLNEVKKAEDQIADIVRRRNADRSKEDQDALVAEATRRFRQITNMNDELLVLGELKELDAEREKYWNRMDENAKAMAKDWRDMWENINQIWQLLKGELMDPNTSPFPRLMQVAKEATDLFWNTLLDKRKVLEGKNFWEEFFKEVFINKPLPTSTEELSKYIRGKLWEYLGPNMEGIAPGTAPMPWQQGGAWRGGAGAGAPLQFGGLTGDEELDNNTRELKRLNDQLYSLLHPPETTSELATRGGGAGTGVGDAGDRGGRLPGPNDPTTTPGPNTATTPPTTRLPANLAIPSSGSFGGSLGAFAPGGNASIIGGSDFGLLGNATKGAEPFTPSGPEGGGGTGEPAAYGQGNDIPTNLLAYVRGIGRTESSFNRSEAYSEKLNLASNNANVRVHGAKGADYGFYQMNAMDVDEAVNKYGMSPDLARHLSGGGAGGKSSLDEQTNAVATYLARAHPEAVRKLVAENDFAGMQRAVGKKWFGPLDHPGDAAAEQSRVRDAARVSGAAIAGGGPVASTTPTTAPFDVHGIRTTIDTSAVNRAKAQVEAAGHLRIEVPGGGGGNRPNSAQLFNATPMIRQNQMTPAASGPPEPARDGNQQGHAGR